MEYEISAGAFFFGIVILLAGILFLRFHQWVADNFSSGVSSYERYKLYALVICGLGLVVMINLHTFLLGWFFGLFFNR